MAVFANDGNLLAEFECPHVKVLENNIKDQRDKILIEI